MYGLVFSNRYAKMASFLASTVLLIMFVTQTLGYFADVTWLIWFVENAAVLLAFAAGLFIMGFTQSIGLTLAVMGAVWLVLSFAL